MTPADIEALMGARIGAAGIAGLQLVFPNVEPDPDPPAPPYAVFEFAIDTVSGPALDGSVKVTSGRLLATVVMKEGTGNLVGLSYREQLAALFPQGLRIPGTSGSSITIRRPAQPKPGYAQGGKWRLPLEISFSA